MKKLELQIIKEEFRSLFFIQFFCIMTGYIGNVINNAIVGNALSEQALAALGLVSPVVGFVVAISSLIASGSKIACGKAMGRGDSEKIGQVYATAIIGAIAIGLALNILLFSLATPLALFLGAASDTLNDTVLYIQGYSFACIPLILGPALTTFLQMGNKSTCVTISAILQAVANLLLALAAVNILKGNMMEIGLCTSFAAWIATLYMAVSSRLDKKMIHFKPGNFRMIFAKNISVFGITTFIIIMLCSVRSLLINKQIVTYVGTAGVAAFSLTASIGIIIDSIQEGCANVISMHTSVAIGEKNARSLKNIFGYDYKISLLIMIAATVVMSVLAKPLAYAFGANAEVAGLTQILVTEYNIGVMLFGVLFFVIPAYQSLGYARLSTVISILGALPYPIIFIYTLPRFLGIHGIGGVFIGQGVLSAITIVVCVIIFMKHMPRNFGDLLLLKDDFGIEHKMNISVNSSEEVCLVSEALMDFLTIHNIDHRRAMFSALCTEEMAGNIVDHGFGHSKKSKDELTVDIFAAISGDDVIIRLKDNAPAFNPQEMMAIYKLNPSDPAENLGIRMVAKIAKEIKYQSTFGNNVLSIKM